MIPAYTDKTAPRAPFEMGRVPRAGWYCIEVEFDHPSPHPELLADACGEGVEREVATATTFTMLQARFEAELAEHKRGLLVTRDHATFNPDTDTRACGWLKALHADGPALWAWIEWTPYGHAMVDAGEFVHFSTEYEYADFRRVDGNGAEPCRLAACTITNEPRHGGQTPCTNSKTPTMKTKNTAPARAKNNGAKDDAMTNSEDAKTSTAANTAQDDATATNADEQETAAANEDVENATASNADDDPTAANGDEATDGLTLEAAVQQAAELLGLSTDATPQQFLDAVKAHLDTIQELNEALQEAGTTASNGVRGCNSKVLKFPRLAASGGGKALNGSMPNRRVTVRTGNTVREVNHQDKARVTYCREQIAAREKQLGRKLTAAEYTSAYNAALKDFSTPGKR